MSGEIAAPSAAAAMPPRRWLLLITHLAPGGTREVLDLLHEELGRRGVALEVAALYRGEADDEPGFPCRILLPRRKLGLSGAFVASARVARLLRSVRPEAVLTFMPMANVVGAVLSAAAGVRYRFCTHHQPGWTQHALLRRLDRLAGTLGFYSRIVAVSHSIRDSFEHYPRRYRDRIRTIPNAFRPLTAVADRSTVRRRLGVPDGEVLAVAIGRLSWEKNALRTAMAAARVPGLRLVLVGDGPQRPEIERFVGTGDASGRIALHGHCCRQEAIDILHAADIFLQVSVFEGRSLALLEALSAGKAILASDIPAQREVLAGAGTAPIGLLCDPERVEDIAAALERLTADASLRREFSDRAAAASGILDTRAMTDAYLGLSAT